MHRDPEDPPRPAAAHGRNDGAAQWQTPHLPGGASAEEPPRSDEDKDLDLVDRAFEEGFAAASDPTSFLRLAGVPFEGVDAQGRRLMLLRVEHERRTDIGAVTPVLGGAGFRYAPLPSRLASRRERLRLIYSDGAGLSALSLAEARALSRDGA